MDPEVARDSDEKPSHESTLAEQAATEQHSAPRASGSQDSTAPTPAEQPPEPEPVSEARQLSDREPPAETPLDQGSDDDGGAPRLRWLTLLAGPALGALAMYFAGDLGLSEAAVRVLGITVWVAFWWVFEPIPIPATSLLPAVLFPLFQVEDGKTVAKHYANDLILLLLGGFFIARSIEIWGLHRRIALTVIRALGDSPRRLVLGFVVSAALLSMWISNTATTIMLLPIALSVLHRVGANSKESTGPAFSLCLLLGIAYGANVGGVGSLIGTPPNLIFAEYHPQIEFVHWLGFGVPTVLLFTPLIAFLLTRVLAPVPATKGTARDVIGSELRSLGPLQGPELRVAILFVVTAALWIFKGDGETYGWSRFLSSYYIPGFGIAPGEVSKYVRDSFVALLMALVLFATPSGSGKRPLLVWKDVESVPWGMLLLFGGGFAIASGFASSGLSVWLGDVLVDWLDLPEVILVPLIAGFVSFTTELTSNTASTAILMPILHAAALEAGKPPLLLMLPAILSVSFAFMLPVATAPNAIVFATGRIPIRRMVCIGLVLNLVGVGVVFAVVQFAPLLLRGS